MEIQVRIEMHLVELIELWCPVTVNVLISEVLADNRAIFGFGQGVIIGITRTGFGHLDVELSQQFGHLMVDVFRSVISMKAQYGKGKIVNDHHQYRDHEAFGDALYREYTFHLSHLVNGIDVVDAFDAVQVALMNGIYAQITGFTLRVGFSSFANLNLLRLGLIELSPLMLVALGLPDIIHMRH